LNRNGIDSATTLRKKEKRPDELLVLFGVFVFECSAEGKANSKRKHIRFHRALVGTLCELSSAEV
jgi:hypothetical protein